MTAHIENTLEFSLCADDETAIFVRDWPLARSDTPGQTGPAEGVLIMHGLGEHSAGMLTLRASSMPLASLSVPMITAATANLAVGPVMFLTMQRFYVMPNW